MQVVQQMQETTALFKKFQHEVATRVNTGIKMMTAADSAQMHEIPDDALTHANARAVVTQLPESADDTWLRRELTLLGALRDRPSASARARTAGWLAASDRFETTLTNSRFGADLRRQSTNSRLSGSQAVDATTIQVLLEMGFTAAAIQEAASSFACDSCLAQQPRFEVIFELLVSGQGLQTFGVETTAVASTDNTSACSTESDDGMGVLGWLSS